jgi:hypothetical protein
MDELLSDNLWASIRRLAKKSSAKRAAVAYVTSDEHVKFGDGDVLVTDAGNKAIASGQTDAELLVRAFKRGAQLYSLPGLHTKVLLLGGTVVIGSANLSESSASVMVEAAWVTDSPAAVGMATSLISQLTIQAKKIDPVFLDRILKIKVNVQPHFKGKQTKPKQVKIPKHRTWVLGVHELIKDYPAEQEFIESGTAAAEGNVTKASSDVSWIRWTGNSRFRSEAKEGDTVIQIWSAHGSKTSSAVYRHAPILHRQVEDTCSRFFVEDFADCNDTSITWSRFKKLVKKLDMPGKIGPSSARGISEAYSNALFALWGE